jgi:predicted RNA-binding protein with PUA-like domain
MAMWLFKTEADCYGWDHLARDGKTVWDGISNATARIHLRKIVKGDLVLLYHTGKERAVVGIAQVTRGAYPDPKQKDPKAVVVDLKPKKKLSTSVSLDQIKSDKTFAGWELLKIGRLSVVPVPQKIWDRILQLSSTDSDSNSTEQ